MSLISSAITKNSFRDVRRGSGIVERSNVVYSKPTRDPLAMRKYVLGIAYDDYYSDRVIRPGVVETQVSIVARRVESCCAHQVRSQPRGVSLTLSLIVVVSLIMKIGTWPPGIPKTKNPQSSKSRKPKIPKTRNPENPKSRKPKIASALSLE